MFGRNSLAVIPQNLVLFSNGVLYLIRFEPRESPDKQALKDELSTIRSEASERRKFFEHGAFEHSTRKKTIDDEQLPLGSGALEKTRLIEQGKSD